MNISFCPVAVLLVDGIPCSASTKGTVAKSGETSVFHWRADYINSAGRGQTLAGRPRNSKRSRWFTYRAMGLVFGSWIAFLGCAGPPAPQAPLTSPVRDLQAQARQYLLRGEAARAVEALERAHGMLPRDPEILNDLGLAHQAAGGATEAQRAFEKAILLHPEGYRAHLNLAVLLMRGGVSGRARSEFQEAASLAPRNAEVYWNYATALLEIGKPQEAQVLLSKALDLAPLMGAAQAAMGQTLFKLGEIEASLQHFARAGTLQVDTATFHANYGLTLIQARRFSAAASQLSRAVELDPSHAQVWNHLGVAQLRRGQRDDAVAAFQHAYHLAPTDLDIRFNYANTLSQLRRHRQVLKILQAPKGARADLKALLAMTYRALGHVDRALPLMRQAAHGSTNVNILNNYGVLLAESDDIAGARRVWLRVLKISPGNDLAKQNLQARGGLPSDSRQEPEKP